jgi:3-phosphoshikimate 1-carboxyvinyltransferase
MRFIVHPSALSGTINIPPSKSHSLRAILFATLAEGNSTIHHYLDSPDTRAMITACKQLGAHIVKKNQTLHITGVAGRPLHPRKMIDAGNSGQVLRYIGGIVAQFNAPTLLTGDYSLCHNRFLQPFMDGINQLGGLAVSKHLPGYAPLEISGPLMGGVTTISGEDSQNVTALLIAAAITPGQSEIRVNNPGEKPWIDLTLDWFDRLGIHYTRENYHRFLITGPANIQSFDYQVPGDFSSAAFPIVAALITQSEITLNNMDMQDSQGDKIIIAELQKLGANIEIHAAEKSLTIKPSTSLVSHTIDINNMIDALPILTVAGCFASGSLPLINAGIARRKESDRLTAITKEMRKMGAVINEQHDALVVEQSNLTGAQVESHQDHRIAMALTVAAFAAQGPTTINNVKCIAKSYPDFSHSMIRLGANIKVES